MNILLRSFLIAGFLVLSAGCGGGGGGSKEQEYLPLPEKFQSILNSSIGDARGPEGGVLGIRTDKAIYIGAAGFADSAHATPMGPDFQMRIASMTKTVTASVIMRLVDDGKVSLTDTIDKWFGDTVQASNLITVQMLLNHTSSIHDHESDLSPFIDNPTKEWSEAEIVAMINASPLDFEPGTSFKYCNSGYYLLGMLAEKAGGASFSEQAADAFFRPLGLERLDVQRPGFVSAPAPHFYSYRADLGEMLDVTGWNYSWDWTAGSGVATAYDITAFIKALFEGQFLSDNSLSMMTRPMDPAVNYGFGVQIQQVDDMPYFLHGGENPGNMGSWAYLPDYRLSLFLNYNRLDLGDNAYLLSVMENTASQIFKEIVTGNSLELQ